jgi:ribosomal-protein-alanine N-acetyltransferase
LEQIYPNLPSPDLGKGGIQHWIAAGEVIEIEPASWRDLNALRHLEQVCFPKDAWPLWDIIGVLTLPNVVRLKATLDGKMIGFIAVDIRPSEKTAWIATVCVAPEYQNKGIGRALMKAGEAPVELPYLRLNVRPSNASAIHLYLSLGYQRAGIWPRYYQDGEDAQIMEKLNSSRR